MAQYEKPSPDVIAATNIAKGLIQGYSAYVEAITRDLAADECDTPRKYSTKLNVNNGTHNFSFEVADIILAYVTGNTEMQSIIRKDIMQSTGSEKIANKVDAILQAHFKEAKEAKMAR
jgi:cysteine sulfinate desulfinase/cysteine desulfurase-like protein